MILIKQEDGRYSPAYNSDRTASDKIKVGTEVYATKARNPDFHRKGMALLRLGFENQDKFDDFEIYRQVTTLRAGFFHWVEGKDGRPYPLPHSLSFEKMNAEEFEKWYSAVRTIISAEIGIKGTDIEKNIQNYY